MKRIKQIIIKYSDGSVKGFNLNGFIAVYKEKLKVWTGVV